jgi:hypothetical protein
MEVKWEMRRAFILLSGFFGGCFLEALIPPYSPDKALRLPVTAILAIIFGYFGARKRSN